MSAKKGGGWQDYVMAGGVAGMVSRTVIAPVERAKIVFQVSSTERSFGGMMRLFGELAKGEGVLSLWKGNTAAVVRVIPYLSIQFVSMEQYKAAISERGNGELASHRTFVNLASGSLAGVTAVVATYPLDVVRARMALQTEGLAATNYRNMVDALVQTARNEGAVALYRGMGATIVGAAPYTGLKFAIYGKMKDKLADFNGVENAELLPGWMRVYSGAMAGLLALTTVYPFDVIRRRMQTHKGGAKYPSIVAAFTTIYRNEGLRNGLYRGLTLNYLKTLPNVAIYMSLYDYLKAELAKR